MKRIHNKKTSVDLINLKKIHSYHNKSINEKSDLNKSQKHNKSLKNIKSIKNIFPISPHSNAFPKKNKNENKNQISFKLLRSNSNIVNSPIHISIDYHSLDYTSLKKKNIQLKNEITNYKLKIKMIENQIRELNEYINKKETENVNEDTIKSLSITSTDENIKKK